MSVGDLMDGMLADVHAGLGTPGIVVRVRTPGAITAASETRAFTSTDYTVNAVVGPLRQSPAPDGKVLEEQEFRVRKADLGSGLVTPAKQDVVVDAAGVARNIAWVDSGASGREWILRTRVTRKT